MGNRKHIDRLFQERFKDFEATPDKAVWENIHKELKLQQQEEERRVIPLWLKISGIAASLVLLISLSFVIFSDSEPNSNSIVSPNDSKNTTIDPTSDQHNPIVTGASDQDSNNNNTKTNQSNTTIASDQQEDLKENQENNIFNTSDQKNNRVVTNNNQVRFKNNTKDINNNKNNVGNNKNGLANTTNTNKERTHFNNNNIKETLKESQNTVIANNNKTNKKSSLSEKNNTVNNSSITDNNNHNTKTPNLVQTNKNVIANASDRKSDNGNEQSISGFNKDKIQTTIDKTNNRTNEATVENGNTIKEDGKTFDNKTDNNLVQSNNTNNQTNQVTDTQNNSIDKEKGNAILEQQSKTDEAIAQTDGSANTTEGEKEDAEKEEENPEEKTIEDAIADQEEIKEENENDDSENALFKKWDVAPNIAPVYYNSLSSGSPIDEQFKSNPKKGQVNVSYGINVSYALNKKLKLRSGINRLEVGYNTENVAVLPAEEASGDIIIKNIDLSAAATELNIGSSNGFAVSQIPASFESLFDASLEQRFGYLEVPLELSYKLTDRKLSINVIGGLSSFFLNKNEVFAKNSGNTTYLGKANNLNDVSFSTNIGLGFNYKISKAFNLNFEPMFKYQLNSFSKDAGNFRPYILGVYSGLSFKF